MKNFGKIISDKDIITKEYLDSKGYISAINSKMVTDALGFTPFDSAAFTQPSIKNALGISDWALAASKPSYKFSEIGSKPTTLSGYGITDAVRQENGITPTASPNVMGYAGGGEGWPVGGPVMVWGSGSYFARLCVDIWETNPTMMISCLAGDAATEWATFVTSLNVTKYAMKVDSGVLNGVDLNEMIAPGAYNTWGTISNKPSTNEATILVISSKNNYLTSQILTDSQGHLYSRMNVDGTWTSWHTILDDSNIGDYAMSKAGGTIDGNLTVNGQFKVQTSLASVSLLSNIFDVNASLKVQPGWNLYLNGEAIMKWSDLKTILGLGSLAYKNSIEASDISSIAWDKITNKPTTLSGYGITDAVRQENGITPTASPNAMGYAGGGEGWPVGGPVMVWGSGSYFARLCVNIWETNPTMLISCLAGADATEWATFVTSLNVGQYAMKVDSGILSGANLNELMTPGSYNNWAGVSNSPTSAESTILVISSKTNYLTSQILINAQGHLYSRMNEGGTWRDWRTILDTDNIGTTSLPKINLNGWTISNWNQVRMGASVLIPMTGTQILYPNEHYTYVETLTSSSNISFTLTDDTSGVSVTKIYYIVFQTGSTTPTFTFNRTLYWKDGKNLTALAANKRYRIVIDKDLAILETYS